MAYRKRCIIIYELNKENIPLRKKIESEKMNAVKIMMKKENCVESRQLK